MFTWIPIHEETIKKIVGTPLSQAELLDTLAAMKQAGQKVIKLTDVAAGDQEIPLGEIDPFTFFATFNRGTTQERRKANPVVRVLH
jgi:hypothetical protein